MMASNLSHGCRSAQSEAVKLRSTIQGQTLHVPDFRPFFSTWPLAANKNTEKLKMLIDSMLDVHIPDERKRAALKRADFGSLLA